MFILSLPEEDLKGIVVFYKEEIAEKQWFENLGFKVGLYVPIGEIAPRARGEWAFIMSYTSPDLPFDARHFTPACYETKGEDLSIREKEYTKMCMERIRDPKFKLHHDTEDSYDICTVVTDQEMLKIAMHNCPPKLTILIIWDDPSIQQPVKIPTNVTLLKCSRKLPDKYISNIIRLSKCYLALENNEVIASALCLKKPLLLRSDFMDHWIGLCSPENTMYTSSSWWGNSATQLLNNSDRPYTEKSWTLKYDFSWSVFQNQLSDIIPDFAEVEEIYDHGDQLRTHMLERNNTLKIKGEVQSMMKSSLSPSSTSTISSLSNLDQLTIPLPIDS